MDKEDKVLVITEDEYFVIIDGKIKFAKHWTEAHKEMFNVACQHLLDIKNGAHPRHTFRPQDDE